MNFLKLRFNLIIQSLLLVALVLFMFNYINEKPFIKFYKWPNFGDNYIPWKDNKGHIKGNRYYYIFKFKEIRELLQKYFNIEKFFWYHGNEIFILNNF